MPEETYKLSCSSSDETFINRVDSVFGCLDSLEQKHNEIVKDFESIDENDGKEDKVEEQFGEPIAKCVLINNGKKRSTHHWKPDHVANPSKWKKYSLKDDGTGKLSQDLSPDQLNAKVAKEFIDEIRCRKKSETHASKVCDSVVFKKPSLPDKSLILEKSNTKSLYGSSYGVKARCMDTFEFGGKSGKCSNNSMNHRTKKECSNVELCSNKISLDYENSSEISDDEGGFKQPEKDPEIKTFINKRNKKNRVIRKRTCDDDD